MATGRPEWAIVKRVERLELADDGLWERRMAMLIASALDVGSAATEEVRRLKCGEIGVVAVGDSRLDDLFASVSKVET